MIIFLRTWSVNIRFQYKHYVSLYRQSLIRHCLHLELETIEVSTIKRMQKLVIASSMKENGSLDLLQTMHSNAATITDNSIDLWEFVWLGGRVRGGLGNSCHPTIQERGAWRGKMGTGICLFFHWENNTWVTGITNKKWEWDLGNKIGWEMGFWETGSTASPPSFRTLKNAC